MHSSTSPDKFEILIVDDEPDLVKLLAAQLPRLLGGEASVQAVGDAEKALELLERKLASGHGYDLVLSDIMLPGELTGVDLWKSYLELDPQAAFIFMSGLPDAFFTALSLDGGAEAHPPIYIEKPINLPKFAQALARVRERAG